MELDELRQRWQQAAPPAAPPELNANALRALLTRRSGTPVAKLERNVWFEVVFTGLTAVVSVASLLVVRMGSFRVTLWLMLLICTAAVPYYARKIQLIRRLREVGGSVRDNARCQVRGLRGLIGLNYQACLWSVPGSLSVGLFFTGREIVSRLAGTKMVLGLGVLGGLYLLVGLGMYFFMRWFARWYLQRLYGQHLDQLEASLAELDEPAGPAETAAWH